MKSKSSGVAIVLLSDSTVSRVRASRLADQFRELQAEYEQSLAPDLRHDPSDEVDAMFVAVIGDDVAGCAAISLLEDATAVLKRLYVKPRRRGAGVARSLVHAAIEYARGQRCRRVVLDTERRRLSAAYRLYVSLGFVECEAYAEVGYASPTFMELRLKADPLDET